MRVLLLSQKDQAKAARLADEFLKSKPKDVGLRYLKATALLRDKATAADGRKLLVELSDENVAPAIYKLAKSYIYSGEEAEWKKAIPLYQRYTSLEPRDPRGFRDLAQTYTRAKQFVEAEAGYRKALELDPVDLENHINLIEFMVQHDRFGELRPLFVAGEKYQEKDDLFGIVIQDFCEDDDYEAAEKLAASESLRMKTSVMANLSLGQAFLVAEKQEPENKEP